jgi:hypothetical protein
MMKLAAAAVVAAVAAAAAAAAPPRASFAIDCKSAAPNPPITAFNTGGRNLTVATFTLTGLAHLADPVGFRRFRRGGVYRIPTYAAIGDDVPVTVAARAGSAEVAFAFGPRRVTAKVLTLVPCRDRSTAFAGDVIVPKPGCYTFAVRLGSDVFRRTVPLGIARRCAS